MSIDSAMAASQAALVAHDKEWDRLETKRERDWLRRRSQSTCADCEHCHMAYERDMQPHIKYMVDFVRKHYKALEGEDEERLEYSISRNCENARLLCAWCDQAEQFINAEDAVGDCEVFVYVG